MGVNINFFDSLTSSLLVAIVSYLPFEEVVRTSKLAKQWVSVWRETTNLEFYEKFFVKNNESEENQRVQRSEFVEYVRNFIRKYPKKSIERFVLSCSTPEEFVWQMTDFIGFAVSRNVRELELDFSDPQWNEIDDEQHDVVLGLPFQATRATRIESLKLFACNFNVSLAKNFGALKNVSLGWIKFTMASVNALLVNCPILESLALKKCWGLEHIKICVPDSRLNTLVIDKCSFIRDFIYIEGPKLKIFKYSGRIGECHVIDQLDLVEVDLDFAMEPEFDGGAGMLLYNFMQELYSLRVFTICSVFLQMIPQGDEPFSCEKPLHEVSHLILRTAMHSNEYVGIKFMLNSCPGLQTLTFEIVENAKIFEDYEAPLTINVDKYWTENLMVEKCVKRSLEVVNVKGFKGSRNQMDVLQYIMCYGRTLKEVNLYVPEGENREQVLEIGEVVRSFGKGSPRLQIFIY